MTLLADPPETDSTTTYMPNSPRSSMSTWRLASRLARRETRRRPGRTILAALLIAVPVTAMALGSVLVRTNAAGTDWANRFPVRYGNADVAIDTSIRDTASAAAPDSTLPAGTRTLEYLWIGAPLRQAGSTDAPRYVSFTDAPLDDPMVSSAVEIIDGRVPQQGEVLIGPDLATAWDLAPGDELSLDRPSGTWTVSGIGRYRDSYWVEIFDAPGFDMARIAPDQLHQTRLYDLPVGTPESEIVQLAAQVGGTTRFVDPFADPSQVTPALAWGWVGGALALVAVGIIVAAAFATSARRQLVTVGHLAANGAPTSVIRRSLALQGTWTAVLGAIGGVGLGLAALPFVRGPFENLAQQDLGRYVVSAGDLLAIVVTAVIAGTVAAAVPARSAARVPVMSALAGRRPLAPPPVWLVPTGVVLALGGLGLLVVAATGATGDSSSSAIWPLLVILGAVGVVFGMVCTTPTVVERIGRIGRSSSLSWRLALRSLGRSRTRSAAVVATIAVTVGGAVAASTVAEMAVRDNQQFTVPAMPADAFVVQQFEEFPCCDGVTDIAPLAAVELSATISARLDTVFPDATYEPLLVATYDPPSIDFSTYEGAWPDTQGPVVATPAMLDLLGLAGEDRATLLDAGSLWPLQPGEYQSSATVQSDSGQTLAQVVYPNDPADIVLDMPLGTHVPRYGYGLSRAIVTPEYAQQSGFDLVQRGVIVRTGSALSAAQRTALSNQFDYDSSLQYSPFVEAGESQIGPADPGAIAPYWTYGYDDPSWRYSDQLWLARVLSVVAALLITALVVAIGLSLAAAEGREERNVLAVVGAKPSSLRRQAAARGSVLAAVGITLGIPTGFAPVWVLYRTIDGSDPGSVSVRFPSLVAAAVVVIIPLFVAAIAWAGSGTAQLVRPASPTRQD